MSVDLTDLGRIKVTPETGKWLHSESLKRGISKLEVLREELHRIALREIHAANVLVSLTSGEGTSREVRGKPYV